MSKTFDEIFGARFYDWDLPLLLKLGLNTKVALPHAQSVDLGEYVHRYDGKQEVAYRVRVSVTALPAMFWHFDIEPVNTDGKPVRMTTGSGSFGDYWPTVEKLAEGMITVTPLAMRAEDSK